MTRVSEIIVESELLPETKRVFDCRFEIIEEDGRTRLIPRNGIVVRLGSVEYRGIETHYYVLLEDEWMDIIKQIGNTITYVDWKDADYDFRWLLGTYLEYLVRKYE